MCNDRQLSRGRGARCVMLAAVSGLFTEAHGIELLRCLSAIAEVCIEDYNGSVAAGPVCPPPDALSAATVSIGARRGKGWSCPFARALSARADCVRVWVGEGGGRGQLEPMVPGLLRCEQGEHSDGRLLC